MSGGATNRANWTAIILAGQRPGENAFAASHDVAVKALIPVAGEPMLGRVARTLLQCPSVAEAIILAQAPERLIEDGLGWLAGERKIRIARGSAGISRSILSVADGEQAAWPVLIVTADHVLLTPEIVEWFIAAVNDTDVAVGLVDRRTVEALYPDTRRTWIRFSDGDYTGANLFALCGPAARKALAIWAGVERDRKKALKLLWRFGPLLALRAATRTISLDAALAQVARRAGLRAQPIRLPQADAAIDVDKPEDLALAERILADRA